LKAHATVLSLDVSASGTIPAVHVTDCVVKHAATVILRGLCEATVADKRAAILLPQSAGQAELLAAAVAIAIELLRMRASAIEFIVRGMDANRGEIVSALGGFGISQRSSERAGLVDAEIIVSLEQAARIDDGAFGNVAESAEVVVAEASAHAEDELSARFGGGVVRLSSLTVAEGGRDVFMAFTRPSLVRCGATPNGVDRTQIIWPLDGMAVRAGEISAIVWTDETDADLIGWQPVLILSQYNQRSQMVARTVLGGFMLPSGFYEQPLGAPTASAQVDGSGSGWVKLEAAQYALDLILISTDQVEMRRVLWENARSWHSLEGADPHPDLAALLRASHAQVTFRVSPLPP
jgi:hypothetical protein